MRPSSLVLAALSLIPGAAALAALAEGCALPAFTLQVAAEAGPDAGPEAAIGCVGTTYPDPPVIPDDPTSIPDLVLAVHTIDMGDTGNTPGYDLDHTCTCYDDAGSSCSPYSAQISEYCDVPPSSGIDNQAARLFALIELPLGKASFGSTYFSTQADQGSWSLLIRIEGYNGKPDDPSVQVSLFPSQGLGKVPAWDGSDAWPVSRASVGDGGVSTPLFVSTGAYVAGGVLVATIPSNELTLAGSGPDTITVRFRAGVLTAKLAENAGQWSLTNGLIAARWALSDVFGALSSYRDNKGNPFCTDQSLWGTVKGTICNYADILVDGTQPKSARCDALSTGLGFTADPALLGPVAEAGVPTPGCSPQTDPANVTCP